MTKLIYRGVAHDTNDKKVQERVYSRPLLVYRGVAHNGVRTIEQKNDSPSLLRQLIYRGQRLA